MRRDLDIPEDNEGVIRVTTGDSRKGHWGVIFVFSVCIHVCIFGGDGIECYLSIQGMYGYILDSGSFVLSYSPSLSHFFFTPFLML